MAFFGSILRLFELTLPDIGVGWRWNCDAWPLELAVLKLRDARRWNCVAWPLEFAWRWKLAAGRRLKLEMAARLACPVCEVSKVSWRPIEIPVTASKNLAIRLVAASVIRPFVSADSKDALNGVRDSNLQSAEIGPAGTDSTREATFGCFDPFSWQNRAQMAVNPD